MISVKMYQDKGSDPEVNVNSVTSYNEIKWTKLLRMYPSSMKNKVKYLLKYWLALNQKVSLLVFVDAPGGNGKTLIIKLLFASMKKDRNIAMSMVSQVMLSLCWTEEDSSPCLQAAPHLDSLSDTALQYK